MCVNIKHLKVGLEFSLLTFDVGKKIVSGGVVQRLDGPEARLVDYFDLIAVTSTGGLIICFLTRPSEDNSKKPICTAKDVIQFCLWWDSCGGT